MSLLNLLSLQSSCNYITNQSKNASIAGKRNPPDNINSILVILVLELFVNLSR